MSKRRTNRKRFYIDHEYLATKSRNRKMVPESRYIYVNFSTMIDKEANSLIMENIFKLRKNNYKSIWDSPIELRKL